MTEAITEFKHNDNALDWALTDKRVPVFTVERDNPEYVEWLKIDHVMSGGGEDELTPPDKKITQTFTMPDKPNAGLALRYLKLARENADTAASWLLELAVGVEGYDALVDELSREDDPDRALATMRGVIQFVAQRAMGGLGKA